MCFPFAVCSCNLLVCVLLQNGKREEEAELEAFTHRATRKRSNGGSLEEGRESLPSLQSLLAFLPLSLVHVLFARRPSLVYYLLSYADLTATSCPRRCLLPPLMLSFFLLVSHSLAETVK